jgi:hypothetical protein
MGLVNMIDVTDLAAVRGEYGQPALTALAMPSVIVLAIFVCALWRDSQRLTGQ